MEEKYFTPYALNTLPTSLLDIDVNGVYFIPNVDGTTMSIYLRNGDNTGWISSHSPVPVQSVNSLTGNVQLNLAFNATTGALTISGGTSNILLYSIFEKKDAQIEWSRVINAPVFIKGSASEFVWNTTSATPDNLSTYYNLGYNVKIDGYHYFRNVLENTGGVSVAGYHDKMYAGAVYSFPGWYGENSQFKHDILGGMYARGALTGGNWFRAWSDYDISQQTVNKINKDDDGVYAPAFTAPSGVTATGTNFVYSRNINSISFQGFIELSGLAPASDHTLYLTLPVLTVFTGTKQLLGFFNIHEGALGSNVIITSDSNKCKLLVYVPTGATSLKFAIHGFYQVP